MRSDHQQDHTCTDANCSIHGHKNVSPPSDGKNGRTKAHYEQTQQGQSGKKGLSSGVVLGIIASLGVLASLAWLAVQNTFNKHQEKQTA